MRGSLGTSFTLFDRPIPRAALLMIVVPIAAVALDALRRMSQAVSSTSVFVFSYATAVIIGVALFARRTEPLSFERTETSPVTGQRAFAMGVVLALGAAVWVLQSSTVGLPPEFALFLSLGTALIALQVFIFKGRRASIYILMQILCIGALLRAAPYYLNTYVYASDTYVHYTMIQSTISSGHFVGLGPYAYYPAYHIFNAAGVEISGLPTSSFAVMDLTAIVLSLLLFFAIGRRLISERAGLLAALLLVLGNFYFPSASYQPTFLAIITLMTGAFALILHYTGVGRGDWTASWIAFWIANIATLLIHPINYLVLILILGGGYLALLGTKKIPKAASIPVLSTAVIFIAYIVYISLFLFRGILVGIFETGGYNLTPNVSRSEPLFGVYTAELFYAHLGITAKGVLLVPGILILLIRRHFAHNWPALAASLVIAVPFIGLLGGIVGSLQLTRFLLYMDVLIVFPLAVGLMRILGGVSGRRKRATVGVMVFGLAFLSFTSYINVDTEGFMTTAVPTQPLFIDDAGLSAHEFLARIPTGAVVAMDWGSAQYLAAYPSRGPLQLPSLDVVSFAPESDFREYAAVSLVTTERGSFTATGLEKFDMRQWIRHNENSSVTDRIFDSGSFLVFLNRD